MTTRNDRDLAESVVALGIADRTSLDRYFLLDRLGEQWTARHFVRDWRVAGALLDRLPHPVTIQEVDNATWIEIRVYEDEEDEPRRIVAHELSQPHALIKACLQALRK